VGIKKWCKLASRLKQKRHKARVGSTAGQNGYTNNNRIQEGALTLILLM
jgi:hypothetical protein